jgi:hypothetical protein
VFQNGDVLPDFGQYSYWVQMGKTLRPLSTELAGIAGTLRALTASKQRKAVFQGTLSETDAGN